MNNGSTFPFAEFCRIPYPLNAMPAQLQQQYQYLENERLMHAFGAGYNHSAYYMAQQAQAQQDNEKTEEQPESFSKRQKLPSSPSDIRVKRSNFVKQPKSKVRMTHEDQTAANSLLGLFHHSVDSVGDTADSSTGSCNFEDERAYDPQKNEFESQTRSIIIPQEQQDFHTTE
jgi:hypothetical protein